MIRYTGICSDARATIYWFVTGEQPKRGDDSAIRARRFWHKCTPPKVDYDTMLFIESALRFHT